MWYAERTKRRYDAVDRNSYDAVNLLNRLINDHPPQERIMVTLQLRAEVIEAFTCS